MTDLKQVDVDFLATLLQTRQGFPLTEMTLAGKRRYRAYYQGEIRLSTAWMSPSIPADDGPIEFLSIKARAPFHVILGNYSSAAAIACRGVFSALVRSTTAVSLKSDGLVGQDVRILAAMRGVDEA